MEIHRGYRYRLDLNGSQAELARRAAGCARLVYNLALEQRTIWHQQRDRNASYGEQCMQLVELKAAFPWLHEVPSHTLQQSLRDLDRAFANFFAGRANYPQYKQRNRHLAFRFPDPKQIRVKGKHVRLPKLGMCACRLSRPIVGTIKNATVSWVAGHWYIAFSTVAEVGIPEAPAGASIGVDMGVVAAVTMSDGASRQVIGWTKKMKARRLRLERSIAHKRRHSANRRKEQARLNKLHVRAARRRQDTIHKLTTNLAKSHGLVVVEDLRVEAMSRSAKGTVEKPGANVLAKASLNREIRERSWGEMRRQLAYKCSAFGGELVAVPAHYSSQECAECGHISPANRLTQAAFLCVQCGRSDHADINAARVIRQRGIKRVAAVGHTVDACGAAA